MNLEMFDLNILTNETVEISKYLLLKDKTVKEIQIPNEINIDGKMYKITSIAKGAFKSAKFIEKVILNENISIINDLVFAQCKSLVDINFDNIITIGKEAFKKTGLIDVLLPKVTYISNMAFLECEKLKMINAPVVEGINIRAFEGCISLEKYNFSTKLNYYSKELFKGCTKIKKITIPSNISFIYSGVFFGCKGLESVVIEEGLFSIEIFSVFVNCENLSTINIPNSLKKIDFRIFSGCSSLTNITVLDSHTTFKTIDGNLYSKNGKTFLYFTKKDIEFFEIPNGVETVAPNSFCSAINLEELVIPNSVLSFGSAYLSTNTFTSCVKLKKITLPESMESAKSEMFFHCKSIKELVVPSTISDKVINWFLSNQNIQQVKTITRYEALKYTKAFEFIVDCLLPKSYIDTRNHFIQLLVDGKILEFIEEYLFCSAHTAMIPVIVDAWSSVDFVIEAQGLLDGFGLPYPKKFKSTDYYKEMILDFDKHCKKNGYNVVVLSQFAIESDDYRVPFLIVDSTCVTELSETIKNVFKNKLKISINSDLNKISM